MKEKTQELLQKLDSAHDWAEGQVYGGSGTHLSRTDRCRICSLRRHWDYDRDEGTEREEYRFSDGETGGDLSLRQAISRGCA